MPRILLHCWWCCIWALLHIWFRSCLGQSGWFLRRNPVIRMLCQCKASIPDVPERSSLPLLSFLVWSPPVLGLLSVGVIRSWYRIRLVGRTTEPVFRKFQAFKGFSVKENLFWWWWNVLGSTAEAFWRYEQLSWPAYQASDTGSPHLSVLCWHNRLVVAGSLLLGLVPKQ